MFVYGFENLIGFTCHQACSSWVRCSERKKSTSTRSCPIIRDETSCDGGTLHYMTTLPPQPREECYVTTPAMASRNPAQQIERVLADNLRTHSEQLARGPQPFQGALWARRLLSSTLA